MKKIIFSICLLFSTCFTPYAQTLYQGKAEQVLINLNLKNNSLLPSKVTLISYRPDETGNGTTGFVLGSYRSRRFRFPVGTKIYLANSNQVNTVMSGAKITDQVPFLLVKKEDEGKIFNIK